MNKFFYEKRISQGAGHNRLSSGGEDVVVFDDGICYIDIIGDRGFSMEGDDFGSQVKGFEIWLNNYKNRLKRLERILEACKNFNKNLP